MKPVIPIQLSADALHQRQVEARARDLAQRPDDPKLEDVLLFRARGARLIKPKKIVF